MPVIPIKNPEIQDEEHTYLVSAGTIGCDVITIADYSGFSDNDLLLLGTYGEEKTEIVQVNDASIDTTITLEAGTTTAYTHPANTKVTYMRWNQVEISSSTSESGAYSVLNTINLNIDDDYTYYTDNAGNASTWYKVRFYNSISAIYSDYSDAYQGEGVYKTNSRGRLKAMVKSLFGDKNEKWVTDDDLDNFFYQVENEVFNFKKRWAFLQGGTVFMLSQGKHIYDLASKISDIKAPEKKYVDNVWLKNNFPLVYKDKKELDELLEGTQWTTLANGVAGGGTSLSVVDGSVLESSGDAYIDNDKITISAKEENTLTVTGVSSAHSTGDEIWMASDVDEPTDYTIWGGDMIFNIGPDTAYSCHVGYYKNGAEMNEDNSVSVIPWATSLLVKGVLAYCYAAKSDDNMYDKKRAEFENELKERAMAERTGQNQALVPSDSESYREWEDYQNFDKGNLYWTKNKYRT